jgi:hypothetical protein
MLDAANFPRQINQRNDGGKRADDLVDCTNRFPIHSMLLSMIGRIFVKRHEDLCTRSDFLNVGGIPR